MCGALVDQEAKVCPTCGSSFGLEEAPALKPERELSRRRRKVIGEFEEDDVQEIMRIPGVGRLRAEVLCKAGYTSLIGLNRASVEELAKVRQIGMRTAKSIKEALQMLHLDPAESQRLLEESVEEEFECPVCRTIVSAYDTECMECGSAFERVVQDEGFLEEIKKVGEDKSSLSLFDMKLLEKPKDTQLWVGRGALLRKMENYEEALKSYSKAIAIRPELKSAWIAKAEILTKLGRLDEAASCYREIVDESATAAGIKLGEEEEAMAALEELIAEDCPSCGSSIPPGSISCSSCGFSLVEEEELPLEALEEDRITEEMLEHQLKELEAGPPPREVAKGPGLTNGNGMVNGRGRINGTGLVNGKGRINGTGMVNGKGLVNGKGIINGRGRVNGLINGNGFTNGLSLSSIARGPGRRIWPRYVAIGLAFIILVVGLYGIVPPAEDMAPPIVIDGQFQDWVDARLITEQGQGPNPDTSINNYGFRMDNGYFSYLVGVQGTALGDSTGYDSFYVFIDGDNNPDTGYIVRDMGAEYMIEAFGGAGKVAATPIYLYMNSQDRHNFTQFTQLSTGRAAVSGNRLEGQFILNHRFNLGEDFRILFSTDDYEGGATYSSVKLGPTFGALLITQREYSPNAVLTPSSNNILRLTLEAMEEDVHISSISFSVTGAEASPIMDIEIPAGSSVTQDVPVDTTQSTDRGLIEISVSSVDSDLPYTIKGTGAKAYFQSSPSEPRADGWFGEWDQQIFADSDGTPVINSNNDIEESGVTKDASDDSVHFYLQVEGEMLGGYITPQIRPKTVPSGGEPGQPAPPVKTMSRIGGEDLTLVYVDSNTSIADDGKLIHGIGIRPDYMVRIKGIYGIVTKKEICQWSPGWNCTDDVEVGNDVSRIEISAMIPDISVSEMGVVFASTDWRQLGDSTEPTTRTVQSRGQGGPEPMAPSWPFDNDWISVVDDPDENFPDPSLEILEVYFDMDATYLYVRIRTDVVVLAPVITDNTWWIYLDTNGDGTNDWVVVDMSSTQYKQVHGLAWNSGVGSWGVPASDWYDTLTDTDDDSAIRTTTWIIDSQNYGCIDFAVLRSHIDPIEDNTTITAADNDAEDTNISGKSDNFPSQALFYIVDCTTAGSIPEFETILAPIILSIIVPTVMIKRRKRYLGSLSPRGGTRWRSASSESQTWESQPSSQRQP
jgi:tetratricopeptide (TPR) repeat protein